MALVDKLRAAAGFPRRAWDRRTNRWGDIVERVALAAAIVFIFIGFQAIQNSREETVKRSCLESNARHDQTIRQLDRLLDIRRRTASASELQRLRESRTNTVLLINALSPHRDCSKRAVALTH